MKNLVKSKRVGIGSLFSVLAVTAGCTHTVSQGITDAGRLDSSQVVFPDLDSAWEKDGQFPNIENLSKIKPGVSKDDLYYLLDRPHFSEGQYAREWDYILKFYDESDSVKVCQYKVIFDNKFIGQEFHWLPADCAKYAQPESSQPQQIITQIVQQPSTSVLRREKITLDADALFEFDKSDLANMLPAGREQLNDMAKKLQKYTEEGEVRVALTGHTDHKGSQEYNYELSQRRANTVLAYLAQRGINPASMSAIGVGKDFPNKQCPDRLTRQQEIDCLQPNRRVEADVIIYQFAE